MKNPRVIIWVVVTLVVIYMLYAISRNISKVSAPLSPKVDKPVPFYPCDPKKTKCS